MSEFATTIATHPEEDPETVTYDFVSGLFDLCTANRRILISLLGSTEEGSNRIHNEPGFEVCLDALVDGIQQYAAEKPGSAPAEMRNAVRMVLTLVLGASVAGRGLYPGSWNESYIKRVLTQFVLSGARAPLTNRQ